jgi:hypothetical protein
MRLLPTMCTNDLVEAIREADLEVHAFDIEEGKFDPKGTKELPKASVVHRETSSVFSIGLQASRGDALKPFLSQSEQRRYICEWDVFDGNGDHMAHQGPSFMRAVSGTHTSNWPDTLTNFENWLTTLKRVIETPDLLRDLRRDMELFADPADGDSGNTPLSAAEQQAVRTRLSQLRNTAQATYSLSDEQMAALDAKIDYLVDASGRVGRKDWKILVVGGLFQVLLAMAIPSSIGQDIMVTVLRDIAGLYMDGSRLLPL